MEKLFWLSVVTVFYIYLGYPLLLRFLAGRKKAIEHEAGPLPKVTILTAAFNEAEHIEAALLNKFELDYPAGLLEMIVISDCSDDGTDEIVSELSQSAPFPLRLIRQETRQGKTSALNLAVPEAGGEILVFADANSMFAKEALRHLIASFADPEVGYVTGKMVYTNADGSVAGDGCSAYMRYENQLRLWESGVGSVVGVDGGVDAMRRVLYSSLRADQLPDFVQPLKVVEKGFKVKYQPDAILNENVLEDPEREYRMRVRVSLRALWALWDMRHLHNPFLFGFFSIQLISHKLLRYLAFIPLILALLCNLFLLGDGVFYWLTFLLQCIFYLFAYKGSLAAEEEAPVWYRLPYYFVLINGAAMQAFIKFVQKQKMVIWQPRGGQE